MNYSDWARTPSSSFSFWDLEGWIGREEVSWVRVMGLEWVWMMSGMFSSIAHLSEAEHVMVYMGFSFQELNVVQTLHRFPLKK